MKPIPRALPALLAVVLMTSCGRESPPVADAPHGIPEYPLEGLQPLLPTLYPSDTSQFVVEVEPGTDLTDVVQTLGVQPVGAQEFSANAIVLFDAPAGVTADDFLGFSGVVSAGGNDSVDIFSESASLVIGFVDWDWSDSSGVEQDAFGPLNLEAVHQIATGAGVRIGVVDTGSDPSHVLLASRLDPPPPGTMDWIETCNNLDDDRDGDIDEACSHGTFVTGEIAICAPGATIVPVRALNDDGYGSVLDVMRAMLLLQDQGCQVINLSLSLTKYHGQFDKILSDLSAAGIAVVASAGNAGGRQPHFPGTSTYTVGAAAVDTSATLAQFSGGGQLITLGAPGVGVRSAFLSDGEHFRGTGVASGTSMSAPVIASAIALVMEGNGMLPLQAVYRLEVNAAPITPITATADGTVDPYSALTAAY